MDETPTMTTPRLSVSSLFDQFADGVYTLGFRMLRDRHEAEDVVQETFIKVMKSLGTYKGDGPIAAWLYRIGYREAIAATRRRRDTPIDPNEMLRQGDRPTASVEEAVLATELANRLDDALAQLSEPLRATFYLRDVEELSTAEVAQALDVSESAAKMRLARAREALRVQLKEYLT
ncbi:MAG: RNA polymerase sigma factor [Actinomycetota bacterium]|nr:RNA polymerase sigma factor [Actinomycetota bacterium]